MRSAWRVIDLDSASIGAKSVGDGVSELRVDFGPGYRVNFARIGRLVIVLLACGDKSSQARDIRAAIRLAGILEDI